MALIGIAFLIAFIVLATRGGVGNSLGDTLRLSLFEVISVLTSTGYSLGGEVHWGGFFAVFFCTADTKENHYFFRFARL